MTARKLLSGGLILILLASMFAGGRWAVDALGYCASDFLPVHDRVTSDPYVQNVTADGATIVWWSASPQAGVLRVRDAAEPDSAPLLERAYAAAKIHRETITGLAAGVRYAVVLEEAGQARGVGSFRTDPGSDATIRIGVFGDSGTGASAQRAVATLLESDLVSADLLLHTGDVVYRRGARCDYEEKFFEPYRSLLATTPIYPAFGNHDSYAAGGAMFDAVFAHPANGPGPGDRSYAFAYGPVFVTVLDTELLDRGSAEEVARQRAWLAQTLAAVDRPWSIVLMHRPAFSTQTNTRKWSPAVRSLTSLFASSGVDLVIAGHAHNYERFNPVDGVTYIVSGGGGASLKSLAGGPEVATFAVEHHALRLDVDGASLVVTAIATDGTEIDRARITQDARAAA